MPGSQAGGGNPDYNLIETRRGYPRHGQSLTLRLDRAIPVQE